MEEIKRIVFEADVKGVQSVRSRNVLKIALEIDKEFMKLEEMEKVLVELVKCDLSDDKYQIMIISTKDAKALANHPDPGDEIVCEPEPQETITGEKAVSGGFPWGIAGEVDFGRYMNLQKADWGKIEEGLAAVRKYFDVKTTKSVTQGDINRLIKGYNAWLKRNPIC